jgi:hypothetical protein
MTLALCPAASLIVEANEMATASMVSEVLDDDEAVSLEDREEAIPAHEGYELVASMTEPSKSKAIVATVVLKLGAKTLRTTLTTDREVGRTAVH